MAVIPLFTTEKLLRLHADQEFQEGMALKYGDVQHTVKLTSKEETKKRAIELGKPFYQLYPPLINASEVNEGISASLSDPSMTFNMIKVQMKLAANCQIDLELIMTGPPQNQPLAGDVSPPPTIKPQRIKLILATAMGTPQPATSVASRDGIRTTQQRVNLDGDKLRGKWHTLCIDFEKIFASKVPRNARFELLKMQIMAPGSSLIDVNVVFQGFSTSGQTSKVSFIKLSNQTQQNTHQRNNQQQARSVIRPRRAADNIQQTPIQNEESKIFKNSPQTGSANCMGRTITGNSFTTTATSLNNTGSLLIDQSAGLVFQGQRKSIQQSFNSRQQDRSRDVASANSQSLLKTPQSITSSKTVNTNMEHLPPLFSSNKHQPRILTTQGELNIIHEKIPIKAQQQRRQQATGCVAKSTSVAPSLSAQIPFSQQSGKHSSHQATRSTVGKHTRSSVVACPQFDSTGAEVASDQKSTSNHRYLDKMNERQKRMEQKYFKKDEQPGIVAHHSKSVNQNTSQTTAKKQGNQSISNQRHSRMKMMTTSQSNISGGEGFTPFGNILNAGNFANQKDTLVNRLGGGTGNNFYDFKKSCATFSSTLRNFQDDYTQSQAPFPGVAVDAKSQLNQDDVEESIHEEIDQSGRGRPPLQPHRTLSFQKKHPQVTPLQPFKLGINYAGTQSVGSIRQDKNNNNNNSSTTNTGTQNNTNVLHQPDDLINKNFYCNNEQQDFLDEYDEHYSGLYIVGEHDDLEIPPLLNAPSSVSGANIDVLSNKTANGGFFSLGAVGGNSTTGNQDNKRSFSPAFKI